MNPIHPKAEIPFIVLEAMTEFARELARAGARKYHESHRRRAGSTLKPGPSTPLWNALAASTRPYLRKYGERSKLARLLGVYPARVHEYFDQGSSMPDAERTLLLMQYLGAKRAGLEPG